MVSDVATPGDRVQGEQNGNFWWQSLIFAFNKSSTMEPIERKSNKLL